MPRLFPREFREDVVRVARGREAGVTLEQVALQKWLRRVEIEEGTHPGVTRAESAELREMRRRNRLLEQENEVLRRAAAYLSQANLKPGGCPR